MSNDTANLTIRLPDLRARFERALRGEDLGDLGPCHAVVKPTDDSSVATEDDASEKPAIPDE